MQFLPSLDTYNRCCKSLNQPQMGHGLAQIRGEKQNHFFHLCKSVPHLWLILFALKTRSWTHTP